MFGCKMGDLSDAPNPEFPSPFSLKSSQQVAMPNLFPWTQNINVDEHPAVAADDDGEDVVAPYDV